MQTQSFSRSHPAVDRPGISPTPCARCEHKEFLHCDVDVRRCLYSECGCAEYSAESAA